MRKSIEYLRIILLPFSWLYGLIIFIRNKLYDKGVFKSEKFTIPVICIGNITAGGTGKTPHTEYLIRLLSSKRKLAVLSRGYGRSSKGFYYVERDSPVSLVGDEPLQMKQKFPQVTIAVDADRCNGIRKLQADGAEIVLLDDAFQHRAVTPSHTIVLMDYNRLPHKDFYLPAGNLRDGIYSLKRADVLLITKAPQEMDEEEKALLTLRYGENKSLFFSHFAYTSLRPYLRGEKIMPKKGMHILLVTGIASPRPLQKYFEEKGCAVTMCRFPDHYKFSKKDLQTIAWRFKTIRAERKIIVTTEKDKVKLFTLLKTENNELLSSFYYQPITVVLDADIL